MLSLRNTFSLFDADKSPAASISLGDALDLGGVLQDAQA